MNLNKCAARYHGTVTISKIQHFSLFPYLRWNGLQTHMKRNISRTFRNWLLLKNRSLTWWQVVLASSMLLRVHLKTITSQFFGCKWKMNILRLSKQALQFLIPFVSTYLCETIYFPIYCTQKINIEII